MRRRSFVGPIMLILIGGLFLAYNLRPDVRLFDLVALYWPVLLIVWGVGRLIEVLIVWFRGRPQRGSFSAGEIVLIVFICLIGSGFYTAHRHGFRFNNHGLEMFGEQFEYDLNATQPLGTARRVVIQNPRGNVRVTGTDAQQIEVTGRKAVRAFRQSEADEANRQTPLEVVPEGDSILIRTNQERVSGNRRVSADLEIHVPRGVSVTANGGHGDFDFSELDGSVDVDAERADVRLSRIGGNARIIAQRSDLVRAIDVKGNLDLQGRGSDLELESIAGQVTITGAYGGNLEFKNLARPLHLESQNTDLRVEALPGEISMDLGDFTAKNLVGPIRLVTKSRDIRLENFSNALELETERGDIDLQPSRLPLAKMTVRSRAGRIALALPGKASFQLEATAERGEADNEFGPAIQKETDGRTTSLKGKVGEGPTILLVTERGSVTVKKADSTSTSEATL